MRKERVKTHEILTEKEFFEFDCLEVSLQSNSTEAVEICRQYFKDYRFDPSFNHKERWAVIDRVDPAAESVAQCLDRDMKTVTITRPPSETKVAMRVIRSLMMYGDIDQGKVMFKAASFVNEGGKGIALIGEKGAGKTSILLDYLLREEQEGSFVSNSQLSFGLREEQTYGYGYPMAIGVRLEALKGMCASGSPHLAPLVREVESDPGYDGRYYLSPADLDKHLSGEVRSHAPMDALVIIQQGAGPAIEQRSLAELTEYLEQYYLRYYNADQYGWYNQLDIEPPNQAERIGQVLAGTEIYLLTHDISDHPQTLTLLDQI